LTHVEKSRQPMAYSYEAVTRPCHILVTEPYRSLIGPTSLLSCNCDDAMFCCSYLSAGMQPRARLLRPAQRMQVSNKRTTLLRSMSNRNLR